MMLFRLPGRLALPAAISFVLAGCDTGVDTSLLPDGGSPTCQEATMHSDLEWIQDRILTPTCASFSSCHMGAALQAAGVNLEEGMTEESLIGVESKNVAELGLGPMHLVEPGNCDESYVIVVLRGEPDELINPDIGPMPFGNPLLCAEQVDAICRWIESLEPEEPDEEPDAGQP